MQPRRNRDVHIYVGKIPIQWACVFPNEPTAPLTVTICHRGAIFRVNSTSQDAASEMLAEENENETFIFYFAAL